MPRNTETMEKSFSRRLGSVDPRRIVFVGVGNRLRGDDGIGPEIIDRLEGRVPHALNTGSVPENHTGAIKRLKPAAIVFIDALDFGASPGSVRIVEAADVEKYGASTHNISLDVAMDYLAHETGADVFLIGVQPARIAEGEGLSPEIGPAVDRIARLIEASTRARPGVI